MYDYSRVGIPLHVPHLRHHEYSQIQYLLECYFSREYQHSVYQRVVLLLSHRQPLSVEQQPDPHQEYHNYKNTVL